MNVAENSADNKAQYQMPISILIFGIQFSNMNVVYKHNSRINSKKR